MKYLYQNIQVLLVFAISFILLSCGDEEIQIATKIELSPSAISLNDSQEGTILITPNGTAEWLVASKPNWLTVTPETGIASGATEIKLNPDISSLEPGTYTGEVKIASSSAGIATAQITLTVGANPKAHISSSNFNFPSGTDTLSLNIENIGTGALNWELTSGQDWLRADPAEGTLSTGESTEVFVIVSRENQPIGSKEGSLLFKSNSKDGDMTISSTMEVPELAIIGTSLEDSTFNYFINEQEFTITNKGNVAYTWSMEAEQRIINAIPSTGSLQVGESIVVKLHIDRSGLETGEHNSEISISNNKGGSVSIPVIVKHFNEEKWLIEGVVKDAEYDRVNDKLIVVVDSELRKYDFGTKSMTNIALPMSPSCVSISQDGQFAAVGHNALISYVDLTSMELLETYPVTTDVFDIVLAPNNYVYAFPREDQWEQIRCINIATKEETFSSISSIYAKTKAKLHPSGNYIYGADNGLSPSDIEKYDITGGTATYLYDSPYHGDYSMGGDLWIQEDGSRIFTRAGNIFRLSTEKSGDMLYAGALEGVERVIALDHSFS